MTEVVPYRRGEAVPLSRGSRLAKVLFVGASAVCVLCGLVSQGTLGFFAFAGFLLLIGWRYVPLSEVETDGQFLYVSQLLARARVPLSEVSAVRAGVVAEVVRWTGWPPRTTTGQCGRFGRWSPGPTSSPIQSCEDPDRC